MEGYSISGISEGENSVLFDYSEKSILYEKLSGTIHAGERKDLNDLQKRIENVEYSPFFESSSLKNKKREKRENIILNVTESCNFDCLYCIYSGNYENERVENNNKMGFDIAKKSIDFFIKDATNPFLVSFYGGEPLNNMGLIKEIVDYVRQNNLKKECAFSMTSNFYDADKYLEEIVKNKIHINISLDGPERIHDKNRRLKSGKPTYEKIRENLNKFESFAPGYAEEYFHYNVTCKDSEDLPEIVEFFNKNEKFKGGRISMIETKGLKNKSENNSKDDKYFFQLMTDYVVAILSEENPGIARGFFDQNLKRVSHRDRRVMPKKLSLNGCCYPGNRKLFVDTNGDFYICERFGRRVQIGNAEKGINHKQISNAIDEFCSIRNNLCNDCWAQRICSPCVQSAKETSEKEGISKEGLSHNCDLNKFQNIVAFAQYELLVKRKRITTKYINSIPL